MSKSDDDKGKVITFKKKKDNLLEQSKKLRLELNKGDKYKTAVQEQKYSKERAKHIKEISEPYKDKTDEELVDIYVKMSRRAGSQFHVDNAKEHAQTLADKGKFDREATLEAINAVKNRLKKP